MGRLDLPRTVVFGDQDKFFDPVKSAAAFRRVDGIRVEVIGGVGHSPNIERPAAVAELVGQAAGAPA
jgi:pimeloyl-ACP methyl ester carboxylesterase